MRTKRTTVENSWICRFGDNEIIPLFGDIEVEDGIITKIREKSFANFLKNPLKIRKDSVNAEGRVITSPKVNFHDHIYSRLATGLPISEPQSSFYEILHNYWWKIDRALDLSMVKASAELTALESIKQGVLYLFDHHASPNAVDGSLYCISKILHHFGLRGVLSFEISDRNGIEITKKSVEENRKFVDEYPTAELKGMLGMHASFTVSNDTLIEAAQIMKEYNMGLHIHACEDKIDRSLSYEFAQQFPIDRLVEHNLLNYNSIIAHGVHLTESDFHRIIETGAAIVLNLESNMNNAVGLPDISNIPEDIPILFGTDGMHSDPLKGMKLYYLLLRNMKIDFDRAVHHVKKSFIDQIVFVQRFFPDYSTLNELDPADFIIWDYCPATPLNTSNFWGHFLYRISESRVRSVLKDGRFLMHDFKLSEVDELSVHLNTRTQGERLYSKFSSELTEAS